jgi:hypothetical protein
MNIKALFILGAFIAILLFGSSLYSGFNGWFQTVLNGPEYCFSDISQTDISIAAQGISIKYTKTSGDQLCFRAKDSSIVERLNKQIQDRKLQAQLANIAASDKFWNETFPFIFLVGSGVLLVIFIILYFSNRNSGGYY